jgi:hypothetical protein
MNPAHALLMKLWNYYLQLVQVEETFRTLKSDLAIRPIFHQEPPRIEAHVFVAFLAYCKKPHLQRNFGLVIGDLGIQGGPKNIGIATILDDGAAHR